jgi:hypothetical protein
MRKIILASVMTLALSYVGPIDFSYAEDLAKDLSELTGTEIAEENMPMILAQEKSTTSNYQFSEPYDTKEVEEADDDDDDEEEVEEEEEYDDPDAGVRQKKRNERISKKVRSVK